MSGTLAGPAGPLAAGAAGAIGLPRRLWVAIAVAVSMHAALLAIRPGGLAGSHVAPAAKAMAVRMVLPLASAEPAPAANERAPVAEPAATPAQAAPTPDRRARPGACARAHCQGRPRRRAGACRCPREPRRDPEPSIAPAAAPAAMPSTAETALRRGPRLRLRRPSRSRAASARGHRARLPRRPPARGDGRSAPADQRDGQGRQRRGRSFRPARRVRTGRSRRLRKGSFRPGARGRNAGQEPDHGRGPIRPRQPRRPGVRTHLLSALGNGRFAALRYSSSSVAESGQVVGEIVSGAWTPQAGSGPGVGVGSVLGGARTRCLRRRLRRPHRRSQVARDRRAGPEDPREPEPPRRGGCRPPDGRRRRHPDPDSR